MRGTLKITSAMKLVASSKLRKAQSAVEALRPYEEALCGILRTLMATVAARRADGGSADGPDALSRQAEAQNFRFADSNQADGGSADGSDAFSTQTESQNFRFAPSRPFGAPVHEATGGHGSAASAAWNLALPRVVRASGAAPSPDWRSEASVHEATGGHGSAFAAWTNVEQQAPCTVVVAISSNSSLCGAFNSNVIKRTLSYVSGCEGPVAVVTVGRKIADAVRHAGLPVALDCSELAARPSFEQARQLSLALSDAFSGGELSSVVMIYNHFVSTSHQEVVVENYLPFDLSSVGEGAGFVGEDYLVEPSPEEALSALLPRVLALKMYAAVLDSQAAEHAARTVAMQTATDNATELLSDLTLEYNKGRQQKITSEILDLARGRQL